MGYLKNPAFGNCSHIGLFATNSENSPPLPILSINPPRTISQPFFSQSEINKFKLFSGYK